MRLNPVTQLSVVATLALKDYLKGWFHSFPPCAEISIATNLDRSRETCSLAVPSFAVLIFHLD